MALIRGFVDRFVLVAGIVSAGCVPSFIAQYRQRVGGRLDQALQDIEPFQKIANQFHHGSLPELIRHHLASTDATFRSEGAAVQAMIESVEQLRLALQALDTDLFNQLIYMITRADPQTARAAWEIFSPSFALTPESVVFAAAIGTLVWTIFMLAMNIFSRLASILSAR